MKYNAHHQSAYIRRLIQKYKKKSVWLSLIISMNLTLTYDDRNLEKKNIYFIATYKFYHNFTMYVCD